VAVGGIATKRLNWRQASLAFLGAPPELQFFIDVYYDFVHELAVDFGPFIPKSWASEAPPSSPQLYLVIFGYQCQSGVSCITHSVGTQQSQTQHTISQKRVLLKNQIHADQSIYKSLWRATVPSKSKVGTILYQARSCSQCCQGVEEPMIPGTINDDLSDWRVMRAVRKQVREDINLLKESTQKIL